MALHVLLYQIGDPVNDIYVAGGRGGEQPLVYPHDLPGLTVRSLCEHHSQPLRQAAFVGVDVDRMISSRAGVKL
jgi:hypothetical protein